MELAAKLRAPSDPRQYAIAETHRAVGRWSPAIEHRRRIAIDQSASNYKEDLGLGERSYKRLLVDLTEVALIAALDSQPPRRQADPVLLDKPAWKSQPSYLDEVIADAIALGEEFQQCDETNREDFSTWAADRSEQPRTRSDRLDIWRRDTQPVWTIRNKKFPLLSKDQIALAVSSYLGKTYRSVELDRHLYRALVASEMYAFGDEMYHEDVKFARSMGLPVRSPLKRRPALLTYGAWALVPCAILGAAGWGLSRALDSGDVGLWANWIGFAIGVIAGFFASLIPTTVPAEMKRQGEAIRKVHTLLQSMIDTYNEVPEEGSFSPEKLAEKVEAARKNGVAWPSPLHALLADMATRSRANAYRDAQ